MFISGHFIQYVHFAGFWFTNHLCIHSSLGCASDPNLLYSSLIFMAFKPLQYVYYTIFLVIVIPFIPIFVPCYLCPLFFWFWFYRSAISFISRTINTFIYLQMIFVVSVWFILVLCWNILYEIIYMHVI